MSTQSETKDVGQAIVELAAAVESLAVSVDNHLGQLAVEAGAIATALEHLSDNVYDKER